jgi:hypothetical protein
LYEILADIYWIYLNYPKSYQWKLGTEYITELYYCMKLVYVVCMLLYKIFGGYMKEINYVQDLSVGGRIILRFVLK